MMVERAPPGALDDVLAAFEIPRVRLLDDMCEAGLLTGSPLIVGWDGARRCAKLYVNASDAPASARATLAARLGGEAAHVFGVNVFADGSIEEKRYVQRGPEAASELGPVAQRLIGAAGHLLAGVVTSRTPSALGEASLRAVFVALRPGTPAELDAMFGYLPGFSWQALLAGSPFPPAPPRSIGISATQPTQWTAYLKPHGEGEPSLHSLEPFARFQTSETKLAFFIGPSATTERAYARVGELALSYRVVAGAPTEEDLGRLLPWIVQALAGASLDRLPSLERPPLPWRRGQSD